MIKPDPYRRHPLNPILDVADGVDLQPLRQLLEGRHGLQLAIVFGSLARGAAGTNSDLDIAVQADRPLSAARGAELHVFDTEDFLPYAQRMLRERRRAWIG